MSADAKYVNYMAVTIQSILDNANDGTVYDFYLLLDSDVSDNFKKTIVYEISKCKPIHHSVNFIDRQSAFSNACMTKLLVGSKMTFDRLFVAKLLPLKHDFCIYLDTDLVVDDDLSQMFNFRFEMSNDYIGAVRDFDIEISVDDIDKHFSTLGIAKNTPYINAGVLLINLKTIRQDNIVESFEKESQNYYLYADQDILNKVCLNKIYLLPQKYNVTPNIMKMKDFKTKDATIFHFCGKGKPNEYLDMPCSQIWWAYARRSPFYEKILLANVASKVADLDEKIDKDLHYFLKLHKKYIKLKRLYYKIASKIVFGKTKKRFLERLSRL
jgi:lipopolysaccharide biosynthesis glycosyltransferase